MTGYKIRRPTSAVMGGIFAVISAVLSIFFLAYIAANPNTRSITFGANNSFENFVYIFVFSAAAIVGGVLVFVRKYLLGGILIIVCGAVISIPLWYVGIWCVIGGILCIVAKEKIPRRVLEIVRSRVRISIGEVAGLINRTEADVEIAVLKLQSRGQPVAFDRETREIKYG